jgi:predicted alpha/beta hydrolase
LEFRREIWSARLKTESLQVDADTTLALRVYEPAGAPRASVVVGAAMGVRQDFYAAFAAWLAEQGFRVTTFDYRGHGDSLRGPMRAVRADLLDWVRDYEAVIACAKAAQPAQPLFLIGHSLGAQLPGLMRDTSAIDGMLGVAAGSGYWRDNPPRLRSVVHFFWWMLVPAATWLCGYFPGRRLRAIGDLPKGVILQWRRWCLNPRYGMGAEGEKAQQSYAAVRFPIVAYSLDDDELMTLQGVERLIGFYAHAPSTVQSIAPDEVQAKRIGHFGFFRPAFRSSLWPRAAAVLGAFGAAKVTGTTT